VAGRGVALVLVAGIAGALALTARHPVAPSDPVRAVHRQPDVLTPTTLPVFSARPAHDVIVPADAAFLVLGPHEAHRVDAPGMSENTDLTSLGRDFLGIDNGHATVWRPDGTVVVRTTGTRAFRDGTAAWVADGPLVRRVSASGVEEFQLPPGRTVVGTYGAGRLVLVDRSGAAASWRPWEPPYPIDGVGPVVLAAGNNTIVSTSAQCGHPCIVIVNQRRVALPDRFANALRAWVSQDGTRVSVAGRLTPPPEGRAGIEQRLVVIDVATGVMHPVDESAGVVSVAWEAWYANRLVFVDTGTPRERHHELIEHDAVSNEDQVLVANDVRYRSIAMLDVAD
jgi:hypothetical protein